LIVRLGAMGDVIHTLSAIAALREAFPQAKIGWIVEERWVELLCAAGAPRLGAPNPTRPLVDFVHLVNTKKWRKSPFSLETRRQMKASREEIKGQGYELAIDFQGAVKSGIVARFAKSTLGAEHPRETPARWFYDRRIQTTGAHVVEQYHSLAEAAAGIPLARAKAEFPRDDAAEENVTRMLGADARPFILINPGAGWGAKQWPAERYGEIARTLAADGYKVLLNTGPGEETIGESAVAASNTAAELVSYSIGELIALTRRARLFIGGDTGPLHLAAALQVPVVAIFGPTDPARNGPFGTKSLVLRNAASRTSLSHTSEADPGLLKITADEVIIAARKLLKESDA
jgi:heptosyltransferase I